MKNIYRTVRLILGDQLNYLHSSFKTPDPEILNVMMEIRQETDYAKHHIQKVAGFFLAMRNFAEHLNATGHHVLYLKLDDPENTHSLTRNLDMIINKYSATELQYFLPDEYRLDAQLSEYSSNCGIKADVFDTEHFFTTRSELAQLFAGKKTYLMENFYRYMRKKHNIMMEGDSPAGGTWNYDKMNRAGFSNKVKAPASLKFNNDASEILDMIILSGVQTIGRINPEIFSYPVNREQSLSLLEYFIDNLLEKFGEYQDMMSSSDSTLFHSRLSFSLNTKMLSPAEVIEAVIEAWKNNPAISINQAEGFIRQILGWREYMRGIYWAKMPEYGRSNYFGFTRKLPEFYWTGNTKMNCMRCTINNSLDNAYAHHIQRLMITGNFALLAGVAPEEVDAWYLGVYIDAIEWVEITNTRGMSQFADGGLIATKPYIASANYINKMSDYCKGCHYDKNVKTGEAACPFNSLYWYFFIKNKNKLQNNVRLSMPLNLLNKMPDAEKDKLVKQAEKYLAAIENL